MAEYEYKFLKIEVNTDDTEKRLNAFGAQGWKVVGTGGAGTANGTGWAILMREA